jgi:hypothetical protein
MWECCEADGLSPGSQLIVIPLRGTAKNRFHAWNRLSAGALSVRIGRTEVMLVERGLQVLNVEVVGDAYAIASNYLRKSGTISAAIATNDRLLEIIVELFHRGEYNRIRLANKAISKFEAAERI